MASRPRPSRTRSVRLTLAGLLVIPLISLVALWAFAASVTLGPAIQERNYTQQYNTVGRAAQTLGVQLAQERLQTFIWLSSGRRASRAQMDAQRQQTDAALAATRSQATAAQGVMTAETKATLAAFLGQLDQLGGVREEIDAGDTGAASAFQAYNGMIDTEYKFYGAAITVPDTTLYRNSAASVQAGYALELVGREAALVGGAFASGGRMPRQDRQLFAQTVANQRYVIGQALANLSPSLRAPYAHAYGTPGYATFASMEDQLANSAASGESAPVPFSGAAWQAASRSFIGALTDATNTEAVALTEGGSQLGDRLLLRLVLAGGVGLLAVAASIFLLVWFSRRLIRELTGLREAARTIADERLPRLVHRLRLGEDVDVGSEVPPLAAGKTTEIAAVAQAFSTVQRTAAEAAVGQAELRKSVSQVFLNLARRNQSLLHRQLSTLDVMERRTSEPEALADLFRLDHLTTRMRRYAESLIILSGNAPGRGWSRPVSAIDVLRAAVAEVEDYTRVDVVSDSREAVTGAAVADVIHLLAELVENATAFSPPNTKVVVRGERVGKGFAVEIEDRGLGMDPETLQAINERLASRPEFDLAASDQLGLFVVGQLAARHGIQVSLRPSPYGGTTAIVLMPHSIMARDEELSAARGRGDGDRPVAGPGGGAASGSPGGAGVTAAEAAAISAATGWPPAPVDKDAATDRPGPAVQHGAEQDPGPPGSWPAGASAARRQAGPEFPGLADTPGTPATPGTPTTPGAPEFPGLADTPGTEPDGGHTPPLPAPTAEPPRASAANPAVSGMYMGLPRRQRQASLPPELRDQAPPAAGPAGARGSADRSPEELRALMTSIQRGWRRGRADAEESAGGASDEGPAGGAFAEPPAGGEGNGTAGAEGSGTGDGQAGAEGDATGEGPAAGEYPAGPGTAGPAADQESGYT